MTSRFISYAQNFEDVMLWRALKGFPVGNYVDIGAQGPTHFSVTKAFYDRGWRGINIDAVPEIVERLKTNRPEDTNHTFFVGVGDGELDVFQIGDTGISTCRKDYAERHQRAGHPISKIRVEVRTLTSILEESEITNDRFHFLKIDVEGAEADVLLGLDLEKFRPWIVVVEATEPNSTTPSLEFEPLLLAKRYNYVYFDGLNRFYVAEEKPDLTQAFQSPPCVFDDFDLWATVQAQEATVAEQARGAMALDDVRKLIALKDQLIEFKDSSILTKDSLIAAKDQLIVSKDSTIFSKDSLIDSKNASIHTSHVTMIHFERRVSLLHSNFTKESERVDNSLSGAYKRLFSSSLWKRGAWIAKLLRSKSPRSPLNKAAGLVKNSHSQHARALQSLRDDMSGTIGASASSPLTKSRLGKSAAAMSDLINAGYSTNLLKQ